MNSLALGLDSGPRRLPDPMIRTKGNYSEKTIDTAGLLIEVLPAEPETFSVTRWVNRSETPGSDW